MINTDKNNFFTKVALFLLSFKLLLSLIMSAVGAYFIYHSIKLKKWQKINGKVLDSNCKTNTSKVRSGRKFNKKTTIRKTQTCELTIEYTYNGVVMTATTSSGSTEYAKDQTVDLLVDSKDPKNIIVGDSLKSSMTMGILLLIFGLLISVGLIFGIRHCYKQGCPTVGKFMGIGYLFDAIF